MKSQPKVSFGFVNCNRLNYLKSCVESLLHSTKSYLNKEFIIIDNASKEVGTEDFLKEKENQGFIVLRQKERDPNNEFAHALNLCAETATGDYVAFLQADMQFIVDGPWLENYVDLYEKSLINIGCITFDAQRRSTINSHKFHNVFNSSTQYPFLVDIDRPAIAGAADVFMSKSILEKIYPWESKTNTEHEGSNDSETKMLRKIYNISKEENLACVVPLYPVSIAIYNEDGTNCRIRGDKRYGKYFPPNENNQYYEYIDYNDIVEYMLSTEKPYSIEDVAKPLGWNPLFENDGSWAKRPIRPETAKMEEIHEI